MGTPELNHAEQKRQYDTNRSTWIINAAPAIAQRMREVDEAEKRRMWRTASPELRAELRRIADE